MPRRLPVHLPDVPLHIVQRGNNRAPCCFCEEDCHCYLYWLAKALNAYGAALHAYVLMSNHVHLLLSAPEAQAVARVFMSLGSDRTSREQACRALFQQALDQKVIADIPLALNECPVMPRSRAGIEPGSVKRPSAAASPPTARDR